MQTNFRNVYCVGRNYASFASEMGNKITTKPIIFMKPTHSLTWMDGSVTKFDSDKGEVNCEAEIVLHIGETYQKGMSLEEIVKQMTVGIDYTYRVILNEVKHKGQPWMPAKGFPGSSGIGKFQPFTVESIFETSFELKQNGETLQKGNAKQMIFSIQTIVDFIGQNYGLGPGDLIYTGTPEGIGKLKDGDVLEVLWGNEVIGTSNILIGD